MEDRHTKVLAPAGIPIGIALWLLGAHIERYAPTVAGLALVAFSLYFVLYPPRPEDGKD